MPDINFVNSPRSEENRLEFTRKIIGSGFYKEHGFIVMPELVVGVDPNVVVLFSNKAEFKEIGVDKHLVEWKKIEKEFWVEMEKYFPGVTTWWSGVEVNVTKWGTVASSGKLSAMKGEKAVFYLRSEADLGHLAAMMINTILHEEKKDLGVTWTKREALMDFIMTRPVMKSLFPDFKPVFAQLSRVPMKWRKYSEKYVESLGIPTQIQDYAVVGGKVVIKGKVVGAEMTKQDKEVMKLLIAHKGELVNYDELADALWGEGEFKSFWAINKLMERIRPKLEKMGVDGKRIESVRGQGVFD